MLGSFMPKSTTYEQVRAWANANPDKYIDLQRRTKGRRNDNRAFFLAKLGGRCVDCGYNEKSYALDFDHINPETKLHNVAALMALKNRDTIWAEVQKCQILCVRCHRIRSIEAGHIGRKRKPGLWPGKPKP